MRVPTSTRLERPERSSSPLQRIGALILRVLMVGSLVIAPVAGRGAIGTTINTQAIANEEQGANWLSSGRTYSENQFSPLKIINDGNIAELGLAWYLDLPGQRTLQASPLAVAGVLYFSGTNGWVFAVDGRTGSVRWKFDPDLAHHSFKTPRPLFGSNRGVGFWKGKVYVATADGRLVALDADTGRLIWSVQTLDEPGMEKTISGAPRVFDGRVIIGNGGYDATRGYVSAYDARTGRRLWRFHTVPGDPSKGFENAAMERAATTWTGEWWKRGGHGVVWDTIVCDPRLSRVYLGTASAMQAGDPGDKLYAASIIALDAKTGKYIWHYQVNPGSILQYEMNYDATAPIILSELEINGSKKRILMQAPKNGFFYVLDRVTGQLISADKIGKVNWADRVDLASGRPVAGVLPRDSDGVVKIWPGLLGVHDWQKMSFHPDAGLVYIPTAQLGMRLGTKEGGFGTGDPGEGSGGLLAWDPVKRTERWRVPIADSFWNGGTLATAGNLVFQGTGRGYFRAYDANSGEQRWEFNAELGINAAPMTYAVNGVQYISLLVGYGGTANATQYADYGWRFNEQPRRLLTFALGGQVRLPPSKPPRFHVNAMDDPSIAIDETLAATGRVLFSRCGVCHGTDLNNYASVAPDLRESALALHVPGFDAVVRGGALASAGMPKFDDLSDTDLMALYMFVRKRSRESVQMPGESVRSTIE